MDDLERTLRDDLMRTHGAVLGSRQLVRVLGFRTQAAFARSVREGRLTFQMFSLPGRTGRFAAAPDVAHWIASQRNASIDHEPASAVPSATAAGEEVPTKNA